jgi:DNA invertase Pin-like site-specific DNA recombinase
MLLGYVRCSTDKQVEGTSPEEQTRKINALAAMRGVDKFDVTLYEDLGVSGSIPLGLRPAGERLLAEARKGDTVVAVKLDRLFRSAVDALDTVRRLRAQGIDVILIDLGMDPVNSSSTGRLFFGMLATFAEFERERITERMAEGRAAKRSANGHVGGRPPYGFRVVGAGKQARLEPAEEEQAIARSIVALAREENMGTYEICKTLTQRGVLDRNGKDWRFAQVARVLRRAV